MTRHLNHIMIATVAYLAGSGALRAALTAAAVWASVSAGAATYRVVEGRRTRRRWRREPAMLRPFDWRRD